MPGGGSVVVRRQLGLKLRRLREAARKDLGDVAESGLASRAKLSRIENGKLPVKIQDVWALCRLYGADQATTDALAALAPGTHQDRWQEEYGESVVLDWFGLYAGLEATASRIRAMEAEMINGLVQTPDYAAAVIGADPRLDPKIVEQRVKFRMQRQRAVLEAEPTPSVTIVMPEGALLFGLPDVMEPQIAHLRALSATPGIQVLVLPFSAGTYPRRGTYTLLDFDSAEDPSVVYVEVPMGARYLDRPAERAEYEYVFDLVLSKSIPIGEWQP